MLIGNMLLTILPAGQHALSLLCIALNGPTRLSLIFILADVLDLICVSFGRVHDGRVRTATSVLLIGDQPGHALRDNAVEP